MAQAKRELLKIIKPDFAIKKSRKRKATNDDDEDQQYDNIVDVFEHENELTEYYNQE